MLNDNEYILLHKIRLTFHFNTSLLNISANKFLYNVLQSRTDIKNRKATRKYEFMNPLPTYLLQSSKPFEQKEENVFICTLNIIKRTY